MLFLLPSEYEGSEAKAVAKKKKKKKRKGREVGTMVNAGRQVIWGRGGSEKEQNNEEFSLIL